ncbi:MAG TPA: TRAFs-binding domain-containing protein, partial [Pyrinomonadaceae bacterium]|nr:TRAFs-binding domain-containing protein [Pyrinomonadaceae bacterium]
PYALAENNRFGPGEAEALRAALSGRLAQLRSVAAEEAVADSPIFQLLGEGYGAPDIARLKTDVFRDRARYSAEQKRRLADARRRRDREALVRFEEGLGPLDGVEAGVLVDLFLSYRAVQAWDRMIELHARLPLTLQRTVMVREQLAFALNRAGRRREAIEILEGVEERKEATSETYGLLGRVYKDMWVDAAGGDESLAAGYLDRAVAAYVRGFESDWRDAFPGVNALTLLEIKGDEESLRAKSELLPVVTYAVGRRLKSARPDYWDYAAMLELAVLGDDERRARSLLGDALAAVREPWEPLTTANNLTLIRDARRRRGVEQTWLDDLTARLERAGAA